MSYNTAIGRAEYTATAGQSGFTFVFKIYNDTDLKVWLTPSGQEPDDVLDLLTLTTDYSVPINGDNGGTVSLTVPATAGDYITLVRVLPVERDIEYTQNGELRPEVINADQNYQTYLIGDGQVKFDKVLRLPENSQGTSGELPAPVGDAYLRWATDGSRLENDTTVPQAVIDSAANAAAAQASADDSAASASSALSSKNSVDARLDATDSAGNTVEENLNTVSTEPVKSQLADAEGNAQTASTKAAEAAASATGSQNFEWKAQAWEMTANSYAVEPEDTLVKIYSSNGDGSFTPNDTTDYSALHYKNKAEAYAASIDPATLLYKADNPTQTTKGGIKAKIVGNDLFITIDGQDIP